MSDVKKYILRIFETVKSLFLQIAAIYKSKSAVKLGFKFTFIGFSIWFVLRSIPIKDIRTALSGIDFVYLIPAGLCFAISKIISSFRLNMFFRGKGILLSQTLNLQLYIAGMFYNFFLPGGIGGDGYKLYWLYKYKDINTNTAFKALLIDRLSGVTVLIVLILLMTLGITAPTDIKLTTIISSQLLTILLIFGMRSIYKGSVYIFINTFLLSFGVQLFQLFSAWFLLLTLNIHGDLTGYLVLFLISSIAAMVPFSIGGLGAREMTFIFGSHILLLDQTVSVTLSLLFYAVSMAISLPGIYYLFNKYNPKN